MKMYLLKFLAILCMGIFVFGCGTGGGSGDGTTTVTASKINITADKNSLDPSLGETVTLTVFARDSNNAAVEGVTIQLTSTAGFLGSAEVTTDTTGTATVTLIAGPDSSGQRVTITATAGSFSDTVDVIFLDTANNPAAINLTSDHARGTLLPQGETATIFATVTDADGNSVADGTDVFFTASSGTINTTATTVNGVATVTFQSNLASGVVTITGTVAGLANSLEIEVAPGNATSITSLGANPEVITIIGTGEQESSILTFSVIDSHGIAVADGTQVTFEIATPLGGGEYLTTLSAGTINGQVQTQIQSGTVAGNLSVRAKIQLANGDVVSTQGQVVIQSGLPDTNHISISLETFNIQGYLFDNETATVDVSLADRYGNIVPVGTLVYFTTEAGAIIGQAATNEFGVATSTHFSRNPRPTTVSTLYNREGHSRIVAWTIGQEPFVDTNGNGVYDAGEPYDDYGEPIVDFNDNNQYDGENVADGERYIDTNQNGRYDGPNGRWDANTFVWTSANVLWSSEPSNASFNIVFTSSNCADFRIAAGDTCIFGIKATDENGNPLVAGTKITYPLFPSGDTKTKEVLDSTVPGNNVTDFLFSLTNPAETADQKTYTGEITLEGPSFSGEIPFNVVFEAGP